MGSFLVIENTNSGAVLCNEVVVHMAVPGLPFGGHGGSGREFNSAYPLLDIDCSFRRNHNWEVFL